jgi:centrosomal protein CEP76
MLAPLPAVWILFIPIYFLKLTFSQVLAYGEDGVQRPVCGYVSPLRMGRLLASPREAAHWMSLLGSKEEQLDSAIYGGVGRHTESWGGVHSVLAARVASKEERAVLLCSLLLG